jgi:hypothetical protein
MTQLSTLLIAALLAPTEALVLAARAPSSTVSRVSGLRAAETPPPPPAKGRLGATVDQDGKSNVWVSAAARSVA